MAQGASQIHKGTLGAIQPPDVFATRGQIHQRPKSDGLGANDSTVRFEGTFKEGYEIRLGMNAFGTWAQRTLVIGAAADGSGIMGPNEVRDDFIANSTGQAMTLTALGYDQMDMAQAGLALYAGYRYVIPAAHPDNTTGVDEVLDEYYVFPKVTP